MLPNLQPTLRGQRIELRPLRPDDFEALFRVASDPQIWEQHPAKDRSTETGFRTFFERALASGGALIVSDRATGRVIGSSRFHGHDPARREIEVGWTFLARDHWGGVFNGEMKRLMLEHAFGFVERVVFLVAPENIRSQKSVEKIGATRLGSRRDGEGRESVVYGITRHTFRATEDRHLAPHDRKHSRRPT